LSKQPTDEHTISVIQSAELTPHAAALVVMYGEHLGRKFDLKTKLTIGRGEDTEIQVNHSAVSRYHACIELKGEVSSISDLDSTNGTVVNDHHVEGRQVLKHGDFIKVGGTVFKFLASRNIEASYHEAIYRLSTIDGLTGAHNRRHFDDVLKHEFARALRHERPLSLLILDIDNFKKLNDTGGHLAGDLVLKQLAQTVQLMVRTEDTFTRYGGEEFSLVLPEMKVEQAVLLGERLRSAIESKRFEMDKVVFPVTASVGAAQLIASDSVVSLLARADEKLYAAKAAGKNRVCA
jgi:two-component system, cell cycle response regulator